MSDPENNERTLPNYRFRFVVLAAAVFFCALFSLGVGRFSISMPDVVMILVSNILSLVNASPIPETWDYAMNSVVMNIRLPRILAAILVGAALSAAGAAYQGMFQNPLVSPDILGASAGAGFGAALAIYLSLGSNALTLFAFSGAIGCN